MDTRLDLTPWLLGLYVAAPWRRKGIGASLVSAIEEKAYELDIETLYLYTPKSEPFYMKLGWRVHERTGYHGYPVTIMKKKIIRSGNSTHQSALCSVASPEDTS